MHLELIGIHDGSSCLMGVLNTTITALPVFLRKAGVAKRFRNIPCGNTIPPELCGRLADQIIRKNRNLVSTLPFCSFSARELGAVLDFCSRNNWSLSLREVA